MLCEPSTAAAKRQRTDGLRGVQVALRVGPSALHVIAGDDCGGARQRTAQRHKSAKGCAAPPAQRTCFEVRLEPGGHQATLHAGGALGAADGARHLRRGRARERRHAATRLRNNIAGARPLKCRAATRLRGLQPLQEGSDARLLRALAAALRETRRVRRCSARAQGAQCCGATTTRQRAAWRGRRHAPSPSPSARLCALPACAQPWARAPSKTPRRQPGRIQAHQRFCPAARNGGPRARERRAAGRVRVAARRLGARGRSGARPGVPASARWLCRGVPASFSCPPPS